MIWTDSCFWTCGKVAHHGRNACWSKVAYLLVDRKQKKVVMLSVGSEVSFKNMT